MSSTNETIPTHPPSNPNKTVDVAGYRANFYPGFVRRLAVQDPSGGVTELFRQTETFFLPPGYKKPWASSTLEFSRPDGRRLVLQVEDPHQQVERIVVYLKGTGTATVVPLGEEGAAQLSTTYPPPADEDGEILICDDGPVLCPPICPT